ncbi:MAG: DUF2096 family protein [Promethearchaeia archaeon]
MESIEGIRAGWMVLNDLLGDLKSKHSFSPPDTTYKDLRSSKMIIEYLSSFDEDIRQMEQRDTALQEEMQGKVDRTRETLMMWAEREGGKEYRESWEERFQNAIHGNIDPAPEESKAQISDLPRDKDVSFFRIRLPEEIPVEIISDLAESCMVLISLDGERHLQVSGSDECVKEAMRRLGELFYGENEMQE